MRARSRSPGRSTTACSHDATTSAVALYRMNAANGASVVTSPVMPSSHAYTWRCVRYRLKASVASGRAPGSRRHVHLSGDVDTARRVGTRHGVPVILRVDTARMRADGVTFYRSDNGVWLAGPVAPRYLRVLDGAGD
jgi:putative RNA 2'-phosphotransferase